MITQRMLVERGVMLERARLYRIACYSAWAVSLLVMLGGLIDLVAGLRAALAGHAADFAASLLVGGVAAGFLVLGVVLKHREAACAHLASMGRIAPEDVDVLLASGATDRQIANAFKQYVIDVPRERLDGLLRTTVAGEACRGDLIVVTGLATWFAGSVAMLLVVTVPNWPGVSDVTMPTEKQIGDRLPADRRRRRHQVVTNGV